MNTSATPMPVVLSVDAMLENARAQTGLNELGDEHFVQALNRLVDASNQDVALTETGAAAIDAEINRILVNRLRFSEDLKLHPEILTEDVSDPIVILGMPRTGTTKLQRMMSADQEVQRLDYWRLLNPAPFPGRQTGGEDPRIQVARDAVALMHQLMPDWQASHPTAAEDVDEEVYLQVFTCMSIITCASRPIPSYQAWLRTQSMRPTYRYMRQLLKYLQWQDGGKRDRPWIMKSPVHMGTIDLLIEMFPSATLVFTHRDLPTAVASLCRLVESTWSMFCQEVDRAAIGSTVRELFMSELNRHMVLRDQLGGRLNILDVPYEKIRSDSIGVIEEIYDCAGRQMTGERRQAMLDWEQQHPQHAAGKLAYRLEDYGLTRADVTNYCESYVQRFGEAGAAAA